MRYDDQSSTSRTCLLLVSQWEPDTGAGHQRPASAESCQPWALSGGKRHQTAGAAGQPVHGVLACIGAATVCSGARRVECGWEE